GPEHLVVERHLALAVRHAEADDGGAALGDVLAVAAGALVLVGARLARGLLHGGAARVDLLARAVAAGRPALGAELVRVLLVEVQPLRLEVGGRGALLARALVPVHPQPGEAVEDGLHGLGGGALLVRVLDAQDEDAAVALRMEVVEEGGAGATDVEVTGR